MKHPSEDYDVTTCRFQKGSREHEALVLIHGRRIGMKPNEVQRALLRLAGLEAHQPDDKFTNDIYRDSECVAQWAVIR